MIAAEFVRSAISTIPSIWGRLDFIASLADPATGEYRRGIPEQLSALISESAASKQVPASFFGEADLEAALRQEHLTIFRSWLSLSIQQQSAEITRSLYGGAAGGRRMLREWMGQKSYERLIPAEAMQPERDFFTLEIETVLSLLQLRTQPRILIVDDDATVRQVFERVLAEDGYLVKSVGTGGEALSLLDQTVYDVVVLDLSLPSSDGIEVLQRIRSGSPETKVLAVSGFMVGDMPQIAAAAGAAATLRKPATPREFLDSVYRLLDPSGTWVTAK